VLLLQDQTDQPSLAARFAFHKWLGMCSSRQTSPDVQTRIALKHLLWNVVNNQQLSVISLAVSCGAVIIVDELMDLPNVFRFQEKSSVKYDISFLTPETIKLENKELVKEWQCKADRKTTFKSTEELDVKQGQPVKSCLELVMNLVEGNNGSDNLIIAAKILDTNPFKILVDNYRRGFQIIFRILTFIHIIHMVLFTIYALPSRSMVIAGHNSTDHLIIVEPPNPWFSLFLIWPSLSLMGLIILRLNDLARMHGPQGLSSCWSRVRDVDMFAIHKIFLNIAGLSLPQLSVAAFSSLTIVWYFIYRYDSSSETYLQISASVFILGWLMTLYFAKGTQDLVFSAICERIALQDISRFVFMYSFILIGFGLAFHTLLQLSPNAAEEIESPLNTLLQTFNLMLGLSSPIKEDFESEYKKVGGSPVFVYCIYVLYVVTASIVMINLLIAMMTHSFEDYKQNASIIWRVASLKLALNLIRIRQSLPFVSTKPWYSAPYIIEYEVYPTKGEQPRWMLTIPSYMNEDDSSDRSEKLDAILDATQRLERQLDSLRLKLKDADDDSSTEEENEEEKESDED